MLNSYNSLESGW